MCGTVHVWSDPVNVNVMASGANDGAKDGEEVVGALEGVDVVGEADVGRRVGLRVVGRRVGLRVVGRRVGLRFVVAARHQRARE